MRTLLKLTLPLAIAGLAGCATHEPVLSSRGALPQGGTYRIAGQEAPARVRDLVSTRLSQLGFARSDRPDYLVQIGASERPAAVGTLVPDPDEQKWLRSPSLGSKGVVRGITVSLTERENGREIYRATAQAKGGRRDALEPLDPLVAIALPPRDQTDR